jgi:hypothetical protein
MVSIMVLIESPSHGWAISVHPEMVDFGSSPGHSGFESAGVVSYIEDFKSARTPAWAERCHLWLDTN